MLQFAQGFSTKLFNIADANRPLPTKLTIGQIEQLSELSGYELVKRDNGKFTLYYFGTHETGFDDGIFVVWHVYAVDNNLIFYPYVQPYFIRGDVKTTEAMEDALSYQLRYLGFAEQIKVLLPEVALNLPNRLFPDEAVRTMFVSEFKTRYEELYLYLKRIYEE